ncbi:hypothetical protein Tco_0594800 [Tanacetum coccineum]
MAPLPGRGARGVEVRLTVKIVGVVQIFDQPLQYSIDHQENLNQQRISDVHDRWDKIEESQNEPLNMVQSFYEMIKDHRNEKIDIRYRRECEIMIDELTGKFNGMSIEINKKKELRQLEQTTNLSTTEPS